MSGLKSSKKNKKISGKSSGKPTAKDKKINTEGLDEALVRELENPFHIPASPDKYEYADDDLFGEFNEDEEPEFPDTPPPPDMSDDDKRRMAENSAKVMANHPEWFADTSPQLAKPKPKKCLHRRSAKRREQFEAEVKATLDELKQADRNIKNAEAGVGVDSGVTGNKTANKTSKLPKLYPVWDQEIDDAIESRMAAFQPERDRRDREKKLDVNLAYKCLRDGYQHSLLDTYQGEWMPKGSRILDARLRRYDTKLNIPTREESLEKLTVRIAEKEKARQEKLRRDIPDREWDFGNLDAWEKYGLEPTPLHLRRDLTNPEYRTEYIKFHIDNYDQYAAKCLARAEKLRQEVRDGKHIAFGSGYVTSGQQVYDQHAPPEGHRDSFLEELKEEILERVRFLQGWDELEYHDYDPHYEPTKHPRKIVCTIQGHDLKQSDVDRLFDSGRYYFGLTVSDETFAVPAWGAKEIAQVKKLYERYLGKNHPEYATNPEKFDLEKAGGENFFASDFYDLMYCIGYEWADVVIEYVDYAVYYRSINYPFDNTVKARRLRREGKIKMRTRAELDSTGKSPPIVGLILKHSDMFIDYFLLYRKRGFFQFYNYYPPMPRKPDKRTARWSGIPKI